MLKLASGTALAALLLSAPALAQTATPPPAAAPTESTAPAPAAKAPAATSAAIDYVPAQMEGQWLASNFIGETVRGPDDVSIGEINDVLVDKEGRVSAAIIGVGGFLGIGEKSVAVPFASLQLSNERDARISIAATKEQLQNAAEFQTLSDLEAAKTTAATRSNDAANPAGAMPPVTPHGRRLRLSNASPIEKAAPRRRLGHRQRSDPSPMPSRMDRIVGPARNLGRIAPRGRQRGDRAPD